MSINTEKNRGSAGVVKWVDSNRGGITLLRVLTGGDDYSIRQALEEIKKGLGEPSMLAANTAVLDGRKLTIDQMRGACETVPFLTPKRLVVIDGLLERFDTRSKGGGKKAAARANPENDYKPLVAYLSKVPDFTEVVLVDGLLDKNNPLLREMTAVAEVKTFPLLNETRLRQWIEHRVTAAGGSISQKAVDQLVRFVGNDLWVMAGEVDKLVLYAVGRTIEEADVTAVVSYSQEANVFAMVDAILEFKAGVAQGLLQQLFKQGAAPAYLLVMLARQVRLIFLASSLAGQKLSRPEIQKRLGLFNDFVLRKVLGQSGKYSTSRLKEVYHKLLEADLRIKTGEYDGELALSILVAELGQKEAAPAAAHHVR